MASSLLLKTTFLLAIVALFLVPYTFGISCYVCNSAVDTKCASDLTPAMIMNCDSSTDYYKSIYGDDHTLPIYDSSVTDIGWLSKTSINRQLTNATGGPAGLETPTISERIYKDKNGKIFKAPKYDGCRSVRFGAPETPYSKDKSKKLKSFDYSDAPVVVRLCGWNMDEIKDSATHKCSYYHGRGGQMISCICKDGDATKPCNKADGMAIISKMLILSTFIINLFFFTLN